jgi:Brp/Blh family beta-carotene 15,15'-monooxygenase
VATFFSLWLSVVFESSIEDFLAFTLILTFGILHGSNDIKLLERSNKHTKTKKELLKASFYYAVFIVGSALLFYFLPTLSLLLFIVFSGYHFGEQHWISKIRQRSIFNYTFIVIYGIFILFLIFSAHSVEVSQVIEKISSYDLPNTIYRSGALVLGVFTGVFGSYGYFKKNIEFNPWKQVFFLLVFYIVFNTASLMWSFAIYFIFWHSLPSMLDQTRYLYGKVSAGTIKKYVISSFPYWLVSVLGMGIFIYLFKDRPEASLALFFSFLAAITFPHVLVINRLYKS